VWVVYVAGILGSNIDWYLWRLSYNLSEQGSDYFLGGFILSGMIEKEVRDAEFRGLAETIEDQRTNVRQGTMKKK
jgi:hypothetical protein